MGSINLHTNGGSEKLAPRSRKFSRIFRGFRMFFEVFGRVRTRSDAFGHVRIHSDALGCAQMHKNAIGQVRKILEFCLIFCNVEMVFKLWGLLLLRFEG